MLYSETLWKHYHEPEFCERPTHFDRTARKDNPVCGDRLEFFLKLGPDLHILQMRFMATGCPPVMALADLICKWSEGRTLAHLSTLNESTLSQWVGPLPPNKRHAILLNLWAIQALSNQGTEGV